MNARLHAAKILRLPERPQRIAHTPMRLTPIPWGKRDKTLGRMVCQHMQDIQPPIVIPWSPRQQRIAHILSAHSIVTE